MKHIAAVLLVSLAVLVSPVAADDPPKNDAELIEGAGFALDDVGYLVVELESGQVLGEHNADRSFIPASVAKIPAMAAALAILGGDHRFATTIHADGEISDGVLTGSLILRGGGDPFLTGDDLQVMAKALATEGITKVDGSFLYDASALIEVPHINPMQPEAVGYNTGISSLSVNFNRIRLNWRNGGDGTSATAAAVSEGVSLPLDMIGLAFADEPPPGPVIRADTPFEDRWLLSPKIEARGEDWLPVGNPSLITAEVFRALAAAEGVELPEAAAGATPDGAPEMVRHESPPLSEIARGVLRYSNNMSAELVGLAASRALTGRRFPLDKSAAVLAGWWQLRQPDADWTGILLENHSGLSSRSRTTPRQIVTMLVDAAESIGGADFHDLLREIGWKNVKGTARIKTGTMSYARGLAGYIDTASGNRLAFAVFFNDIEERDALDAAFDSRVKAIDPNSRPWRRRALNLEQRLTTDWAKAF
ncbi:MAG: D-alanyl-D-alanine carboxypeptidase/D-alanyl-D-alanine-endopeptidase [Hyphomicrobiales bacterium]|nr:D-alanyl-D-alanine carboxypeptidase/D-alanyl-D-alanine-endopeptidase [Hyphomicrobiales bacterium]